MTIYLSGYFDDTMLNRFLHYYNREKELTIYLTSEGGEISVQDCIVDLINNSPDHKFKLIAAGNIFSAAFNTFFKANCEKEILDETIGMAHFSYVKISMNESGKSSDEGDQFILSTLKKAKDKTTAFYKSLGFTNAELTKSKSGKAVFFTTERMRELLKHHENGKKE